MALKLKTDWILFITVVVMVFFGAVMVYSASSVMAELRYGNTYYFIERQAFWVVIGIGVFMLMKRTHYRDLQHPGVAFAFMSLVLIVLPRSATASLDPHGPGRSATVRTR
jgi:cell division protein FtsW